MIEDFEEIDLKECIVGGEIHCTTYSHHNDKSGLDSYNDETGQVIVVHQT